ncbi:MAG: YdeI/OmpD-associated family protein [Faecalicatena sp.]|uniref:YdeI/OmpD-associated family protein n=1 Tax=Faecalicatena sp. TaxID=2005360 RepID=UPI00258DB9B0|nr:YdeI/OmpD-associated family protein [Faecalicatena sp.]MCI6467941.1 YdeI/OmpD-associated family protein [Faecalicatena sp.]MDY5619417.1 YdeI/OmpD-associated family protein [Lachnospiraceae bacterium]
MNDMLRFSDRMEFRAWLEKNSTTTDGVWLLFGKKNGPVTLSANDALEEALCFGWIDGQMQSIGDTSYKKYFSMRRANSKWSEKNKKLAVQLEKQGKMTDFGRAKIEEAKKNGQWDKPKAPAITDEQIAVLSDLLKSYEPAYTNFLAMSPSVKKTYTRAYYDAKTDAGRESRMKWMVDRLNRNLKPM